MIFKWLEHRCYPNKPLYGTAEEWCEFHKVEVSKPGCNFCVNILPAWFSRKYQQLLDKLYWLMYRLPITHKFHTIDTGLTPNYYEIDTRMLHGMFNMLKTFCEYDMPYHEWYWQEAGAEIDAEKEGKKYNRIKFIKGKEAALNTFKRQKLLVYTADEIMTSSDEHLIGTPTPQAKYAAEMENLYLWWVEVRPARVDPFELYVDPMVESRLVTNKNGNCVMSYFCKGTEAEENAKIERYHNIDALERQYEAEDDEMLIRLIKIRSTLWT